MRNVLAIMTVGLVAMATGARAQQQQMTVAIGPAVAEVPAVRPAPPMPVVLMLLRSSVLAVRQGNAANNYEAVRALGTMAFQRDNSSQRLSAAFESLRRANLDLSPVLITAPVLDAVPVMLPDGTMKVVGAFPTQPMEVPFTAIYAEEAGKWRLHGIHVGVRPVGQKPPAVVGPVSKSSAAPAASGKPPAAGAGAVRAK